jgi:tRNA threonylcarbamoyladenosine biosynthesis protein TsaB
VTSLDLLAFPLRHSNRRIVCAIDAGRGELFHAGYRHSPGGVQRLTEPAVSTPEDLAADLQASDGETLLVGDGALRHQHHFDDIKGLDLADPGLAHPSAGSLVQLAHARALREEFVTSSDLTPLYLRKPDAEIGWITRDTRR